MKCIRNITITTAIAAARIAAKSAVTIALSAVAKIVIVRMGVMMMGAVQMIPSSFFLQVTATMCPVSNM